VIHDTLGARAALTIAAPSERFYGREDELVPATIRSRDKIANALGTSERRSSIPGRGAGGAR